MDQISLLKAALDVEVKSVLRNIIVNQLGRKHIAVEKDLIIRLVTIQRSIERGDNPTVSKHHSTILIEMVAFFFARWSGSF